MGAPPAVRPPSVPRREWRRRAAAAIERARAEASTPAPAAVTIESSSPPLRAALGALDGAPTGAKHRQVAATYSSLGVLDRAYDHLTAAIRLDRRGAAAYDARARIWRGWQLPHLGLSDAYRAVYYAPRSASAWNTLGTLLHAMRRHGEAERAYARALGLAPDAVFAWQNMCRLYLDERLPSTALPVCERAATLDPQSATAAANVERARGRGGRRLQTPSAPSPPASPGTRLEPGTSGGDDSTSPSGAATDDTLDSETSVSDSAPPPPTNDDLHGDSRAAGPAEPEGECSTT